MRGVKDVENRSVAWKLRGRILIHASATFGPDEAAQAKVLRRHLGLGRGELYEPVLGAILGTVEIVDAVSEHDSEWFSGPVGLVLRQPERWSAPVPRKGAVGIFYVDEHELAPSRPKPTTAESKSGAKSRSREATAQPVMPQVESATLRRVSKPEGMGTATASPSAPAPMLRIDGACLKGTLRALGTGKGAMPEASLEKIRRDAVDLLEQVVTAYTANIGPGEVGSAGTATAGKDAARQPSTGLLYGRIQSGKTVAMIALVAAAIDNGFRVVVVLTSDNVKLVSQTSDRFSALDGPMTIDAQNPSSWANDGKHIGKHLGAYGVVFVCSKNKTRLENLIKFLKLINAPDYPALVLDDEADQATPNGHLAAAVRREIKGGKDKLSPTAIHAQVVDNLRVCLRHHVFVQVTATPYVLLLQSVGEQLRPSFTRLLEPGAEYTGGESFFEAEHVEEQRPPLVFVAPEEADAVREGEGTPDGLRKAIAFFTVAAAAQSIVDPERAQSGQNFLCHTSQLKTQHSNLETLIRDYLDRFGEDIAARSGEGFDRVQIAYEDLGKTMPQRPPLNEVLETAQRKLVLRKVVVVNADTDAEAGRGFNFIIGGNILGRGVTIENLLVTYYLRQPKVGQMDTTLQHARMYGYRRALMPFTRVFLPLELAVRFHEIHGIEQRLRKHLKSADMGKPIVVEKAANLRPTRGAVLDPSYVDAFGCGDQIYPRYPDREMSTARFTAIAAIVQRLLPRFGTNAQPVDISYDEFFGLIDAFPFDESRDSNSWIPVVLRRVIERQRERTNGLCYVYGREMQRRTQVFATGALNGQELARLRSLKGPTFCLLRDDGSKIPGHIANRFWYPTIVLDQGTPDMVVNNTSDEL